MAKKQAATKGSGKSASSAGASSKQLSKKNPFAPVSVNKENAHF